MFRYVACVWDDDDLRAGEAARRVHDRLLKEPSFWQSTVKTRGLLISHTGAGRGLGEPHVLHRGEAGAVLGTLFSDSRSLTSGAGSAFSEEEADRIITTAGRRLIAGYWGSYVAFIHNPADHTTSVLRDPSAGLQCLTTQHCGVQVYWSWMEDGIRLGLEPFHVNWPYITAALCYMRLQIHQTGLTEVGQVLGGECVRSRAGRTERIFYWNPIDIAVSNPIEDFYQATEQLRERTHQAVQAWASCFRSVLLTLSGGLDSSIVLACLCERPGILRTTCVNYHSPGSDTDERAFARIAARHVGCELVEVPRNSSVDLAVFLSSQATAVPTNWVYWAEHSHAEALLAAEYNAGAIFSGFGGDQLFYQGEGRWAASDFLHRYGVRPALPSIAMNAARMDRVSVWSVLGDAFRHAWFGKKHDFFARVAGLKKLIHPQLIEAVLENASFVHPWFQKPSKAPAGKVWHALQALIPFEENPLAQPCDPERIAPLYSQPVLEVCMRIPTYLLTRGGRDRAVARHGFQDQLPREIVERRTKGGAEEHLKAILKHNMPLVRELLLDGELVREHVLERGPLEKMLRSTGTGITTGPVELHEYIATEAWLRRWGRAAKLFGCS